MINHAITELPSSRRSGGTVPALTVATALRCLVVDDHPAIRVGLRELLAAEPGLEVIDAVASAQAALSVAERSKVDVAVVDYQLGGRSGLWLSRMLKRLPDPPAVLIYSAYSDYLLGAACVVAEADGMLSKAAFGSQLSERIREVAAGQTSLPMVPPALADSLRCRLDAGEQVVFGMMSARLPVGEIGRTLGLAHGELDAMLWKMLRKLERITPIGGNGV